MNRLCNYSMSGLRGLRMQPIRTLGWLAMFVLAGLNAGAFVLLGPNNEPYQAPVIGYNPLRFDPVPLGPKNLGEEYRRNTPVMYYTYDANFLDYFGSNGVVAIDQAMTIM